MLHQRVIAQLQARLYDSALPVQAAALPEPFSPVRWTGVVETAQSYRLSNVNALQEFDPEAARIFYKPTSRATFDAAKRIDPFRYFLYFARFPLWSEMPIATNTGSLTRVELTDLRFGSPGAGSFHCIAIENAHAQVLRTWFTLGSGSDLGWSAERNPQHQ